MDEISKAVSTELHVVIFKLMSNTYGEITDISFYISNSPL